MSEYILGSFNMFKFSRQGGPETNKSYSVIADIIRDAKFDLVSMQEVFSKEAVKMLVSVLNNGAGVPWKYSWDEPKKTLNKQAREGYAFIWNSNRLDKVATKLADGSIRIFEPRIINQYRKEIIRTGRNELLRNPYYGRFAPRNARGESYGFELRIINAHIMYKKSVDDKDKFDLSDVKMRKNEYALLSQVILPKIDLKRYGLEDEDGNGVKTHLSAYTVLMGDYNLNIEKKPQNPYPYLPGSFIVYFPDGKMKSEIITIQDEKTTLRTLPKNPADDAKFLGEEHYRNNADHFTYDRTKFDTYNVNVDAHRINVIEESLLYGVNVPISKYFNGDFRRYHDEVSDHLPVMMKISMNPRRVRSI